MKLQIEYIDSHCCTNFDGFNFSTMFVDREREKADISRWEWFLCEQRTIYKICECSTLTKIVRFPHRKTTTNRDFLDVRLYDVIFDIFALDQLGNVRQFTDVGGNVFVQVICRDFPAKYEHRLIVITKKL